MRDDLIEAAKITLRLAANAVKAVRRSESKSVNPTVR